MKNKTVHKSVVIISRTKDKRYRVKYRAANGEPLAVSEVLNTRNNAKKNIVAMLNACGGQFFDVVDLSGKETTRHFIDRDGMETISCGGTGQLGK